jgi:hypothetical protein
MSGSAPAKALTDTVGKVIVGIRRIRYVVSGNIVSTSGPIELVFRDGSAVTLDAGPDGEALAVSDSRWKDPFEEPLSRENRSFVEQSGKWTAFDVSTEPPYREIIGQTVERVKPLLTPAGKVKGATLFTSAGGLRSEVEADDLKVEVVTEPEG